MKSVSVIVLNWNQPKLTVDTINSLLKIQHPNFSYQIFLVDNGSKDDSKEIFEQNFSKNTSISIIYLPDNLGFAGGNNMGIKHALELKYDYILLLNNDTIVQPDFLKFLFDTLENDNTIGIVGPKIYFAPGFEYHKNRYSKKEIGKIIWSVGGKVDWNNIIFTNRGIDEVDIGQYDKPTSKIDKISGCCALIPSNILKKVGFLDDNFYLYNEDDDFCQRVIKSGFKLYYQPKSVIWHINSGSSRSGGGSMHDYYMTRNRLIFGFRYAKLRTQFALIRDSIRILLLGYPWQKKGVVDFYLNRLGKGSWK
jgi:GT2 family glycosyltransferase